MKRTTTKVELREMATYLVARYGRTDEVRSIVTLLLADNISDIGYNKAAYRALRAVLNFISLHEATFTPRHNHES